jgi:pilus assembly protein CpaE
MNDSRIAVVSPDKGHLGIIEHALRRMSAGARISVIEGDLKRLGALTEDLAADILIVDCVTDGIEEIAPLERIGRRNPDMNFLVLCRQQSTELLVQAMRLGVREVLDAPVNPIALEAAIDRISFKAGLSETCNGKVLAFVSCKGGSGATFLAANLAYALAAGGDAKVALFDFNLQFGDALAALTEQKPAANLADVVRDVHRLDAAFLASSMASVVPGLAVLAAPEDPAHGLEVKPDHIDALLRIARSRHDYVILDLGRVLDAPTIRALDHADIIYPVLQGTLPFVRGAKHMLDIFRNLDYPQHKVQPVLNRYHKGSDLPLKETEAVIGARVARMIPNHYETAAASLDQGVPVTMLASGSPISASLQEWCAHLQGRQETVCESWLARAQMRMSLRIGGARMKKATA